MKLSSEQTFLDRIGEEAELKTDLGAIKVDGIELLFSFSGTDLNRYRSPRSDWVSLG